MAKKEQKTQEVKKERKLNPRIVATAWLIFAVHQAFVGYVLLTNFANYFVVASAVLSLALAGIVILTHFYKSTK
jgi:hypothetical protein